MSAQQELIDQLVKENKTFQEYHSKSLNDKVGATEATLKDEIRKSSEATLAKYDEIKAELKAEADAKKSLQDAIDDLATKMNRVGNAYVDQTEDGKKQAQEVALFNKTRQAIWKSRDKGPADRNEPVDAERLNQYKAARDQWVRYGDSVLHDREIQKSMSVGIDPDGGAWIVPPDRQAGIIKRVYETTPMRQVSTVITTSSHSVEFAMDPNRVSTGGWVSEKKPRGLTGTPEIETLTLTPGEIYAQPAVTRILLEDANFDVEAYLGDKVAESFSLDENAAYVTGDGVGKPRGFLTYPAGSNTDGTNKWGEIQVINSGTSGQFTYTGFLKMITAFRGNKYYPNLQWMIQRPSVISLMQLQNNANQYIFAPVQNGQFNGQPFLGYEIVYAADMPAQGAGLVSAALGNWKLGYTIVDRIGLSTIRDEVTAKPFVLFYSRKRVTGAVTDYDAIKLLMLS